MSQKSYNGKNALYIIPTPIGNMQDLTLRTIDILKLVDVIFCEDTRVTGQLLKNLNINKKMISSNEQSEISNIGSVLKYLEDGKNVGIVTDRGTPIISDPGYKIVEAVVNNNYNVIPLPGATALVPALVASGLNPSPFIFYGFLNSKSGKRKKELELLKNNKYTIIFYEAPHRILKTLLDIKEVFGNRKISAGRELTKMYEEFYRGTIDDVYRELSEKEIKGEFVIVVDGNKTSLEYDELTIVEHVKLYIEDGLSEKDAIKKVASDRKIPKSDVYKEYHLSR